VIQWDNLKNLFQA